MIRLLPDTLGLIEINTNQPNPIGKIVEFAEMFFDSKSDFKFGKKMVLKGHTRKIINQLVDNFGDNREYRLHKQTWKRKWCNQQFQFDRIEIYGWGPDFKDFAIWCLSTNDWSVTFLNSSKSDMCHIGTTDILYHGRDCETTLKSSYDYVISGDKNKLDEFLTLLYLTQGENI